MKTNVTDPLPNPLPNPLPEGRGDKAMRVAKVGVHRNATKQVKKNAKSLRKEMTEVEKTLWYHLRAQRFEQFKFRRQHPLGNYIVDFVCLKEKLIIELDGGQHSENVSYDAKRSQLFDKQGFHILRFWNNEVIENLNEVLETIHRHLLGSIPSSFRERVRERVTQ